jgi:hypothetical protein
MTMLKEIASEIAGMFVGDVRLSLAILGTVALTAALVAVPGLDPLIGGGVLLVGCVLILVNAVYGASRNAGGGSPAPSGRSETEVLHDGF